MSDIYRRLVQRLGRITTSGKFIPEIDGLRFVAIFAVFAVHLSYYLAGKSAATWSVPVEQDWLSAIVAQGHYGVHLFFAISGFVLGLPFASHYLQAGSPVRLRAYYLRRLTRLEPPYLISLLAIYMLLVVQKGSAARELFPNLLASCFYVHNIVFLKVSRINMVAWSLEVEVQFYLLAPLLAKLFAIPGRVRRRAAIVLLAYAVLFVEWLIVASGIRIPISLVSYLQFFLVGFLLVDIYLIDWKERPARSYWWDAVWSVGSVALFFVWKDEVLERILFPPLLLVILMGVLQSRLGRSLLNSSFLVTVGGMCYTIYLIHMPLISGIGRFTNRIRLTGYFSVHLLMQTLVVGLAVVVVSAGFFLLIEKPCMRKDWPVRAWAWWRRRWQAATGKNYQALPGVFPELGDSPASPVVSASKPRSAA
jgi:peptidoglycan/LPS O-acetylase OafA/YrhL